MTTDAERLLDREEVLDTVVALFVATDERDWPRVESCLANPVTLDMTSLAGGEPASLTPAAVAAGWRDGLRAIDEVHHQVGNFRLRVSGDEADVSCYGVAFHHRRIANPDNVRTFVGAYDIHLRRVEGDWRIDLFRFRVKFVTGNRNLETAT